MRELGVEKKRAFYSRFIGRRLAVLIEDKFDVKIGARRGFTRNYLSVNVCSSSEASNEEVSVKLTGFDNGALAGTPCRSQMKAAGCDSLAVYSE